MGVGVYVPRETCLAQKTREGTAGILFTLRQGRFENRA
jgi:hypothetical protein